MPADMIENPVSYSTSAVILPPITSKHSQASNKTNVVSSSPPLTEVPFYVPLVLSEYERDQVKHLVEDVLPRVSPDTVRSVKYLKVIHRKVFSVHYRDTLSSEGRRTLLRRILYACVVRQVIINDQIQLPSMDQLQVMPFYQDPHLVPTSELEIDSLRHFMRAVQTMHEMGMPAVNNKQTYIEVAAMLDDSKCTYALGGAPSKATMRRVMIYHGVTGIEIPRSFLKPSSKRRKIHDVVDKIDSSEGNEDILDVDLAAFATV
jgi:hypothetical protein